MIVLPNSRSIPSISLVILLGFVLILPFEIPRPWLRLGSVAISNVELALLFVLIAGILQAAVHRRRGASLAAWLFLPRGWLWLWGMIVAGIFLAAWRAPEEALMVPGLRENALKAAGRTLAGMGLALAVPQIVRGRREQGRFAGALMAGGLAAVILGLVEVWRGAPLMLLDTMRTQLTTVGPFLRLTASYDHANQAAMAIEALLPLLLGTGWLSWRSGRRWQALLCAAAGLLCFQALLQTYSRAGLVTIFLVLGLTTLLLWWSAAPHDKRQAAWWGAATLIAIMFTVINTLSDPVWGLRLRSEDDKSWYLTSIQAPAQLAVGAGETLAVALQVRNEGSLTWISVGENPIHIGARWHRLQDDRRLSLEPRWSLTQHVRPGGVLRQTVVLTAPQVPGRYELLWDMVQEQITWFGEKTGQRVITRVTVSGAPAQASAMPAGELRVAAATPAPIPARGQLWRIAWQALSRFPLTGLGLDNFRLTYGRFLPAEAWNPSIHANNWLLETLASLGLLGGLPYLAWLGWLAVDGVRVLRSRAFQPYAVGVAGGLLAFMIHGSLDYFLMFNSTALLFWLLVGLWLCLRRAPAPEESHAPRA